MKRDEFIAFVQITCASIPTRFSHITVAVLGSTSHSVLWKPAQFTGWKLKYFVLSDNGESDKYRAHFMLSDCTEHYCVCTVKIRFQA
jgi:hypothetical protein